jgi:hypothetical protein
MTTPSPTGRPGPDPTGHTPTETVRLNNPRDLLTAIPFLLGFEPDPGSVVVLALHAGHIAVTIRVDAAALDDPARVWARLDRPLTETHVDQVAVVGYLPEDDDRRLLGFAESAPVPLLDVLRVQDRRWWSLTCRKGPGCCPPGEPFVANNVISAPLVVGAGAPASSRAALANCLLPGPDDLVDAVAQLLPLCPAPSTQALYRAVVQARTRRADGPAPLAPDEAAVLVHALHDIVVRDACCGWHDEQAWFVWTDLIRATPPAHVAPVATLIATTAYQRGDTVLARLAAEHALAANPDYGLALLMKDVVAAHVHPAQIREVFSCAVAEVNRLRPSLEQTTTNHADTPADDDTRPGPGTGGDHDG